MSVEPHLVIELLRSEHECEEFCCGVDALDKYIKHQALRGMASKISLVFVLTEQGSLLVRGYYTLSNLSIVFAELPERLQKRLPKYPQIGATLLGRLAVDLKYSNHLRKLTGKNPRLGEFLLFDSQKRALKVSHDSSASVALVVDIMQLSESKERMGKPDPATFYKQYGFVPFPGKLRRFYKLMKVIEREFQLA